QKMASRASVRTERGLAAGTRSEITTFAIYLTDNRTAMRYAPTLLNFSRRVQALLVRLHPLRHGGRLDGSDFTRRAIRVRRRSRRSFEAASLRMQPRMCRHERQ